MNNDFNNIGSIDKQTNNDIKQIGDDTVNNNSAQSDIEKQHDNVVSDTPVAIRRPLEEQLSAIMQIDQQYLDNTEGGDPNKGIYKECYYYDEYPGFVELAMDYTNYIDFDFDGNHDINQDGNQDGNHNGNVKKNINKAFTYTKTRDILESRLHRTNNTRANRRQEYMQCTAFKQAVSNRNDIKHVGYHEFLKYINYTIEAIPSDRHDEFIDIICKVASFLKHYKIAIDTRIYMNVIRYFGKGYGINRIISLIVHGHNLLGLDGNVIKKYMSKFNNKAKLPRLLAQKEAHIQQFGRRTNIPFDYMMVIGWYLDTFKDHVNLMRVCKEYKDLNERYLFNPIDDYEDFFPKKQTLRVSNPRRYRHIFNKTYYAYDIMSDVKYSETDSFAFGDDYDNVHFRKDVYGDMMEPEDFMASVMTNKDADSWYVGQDPGYYKQGRTIYMNDLITRMFPKTFKKWDVDIDTFILSKRLKSIPEQAFKKTSIKDIAIPDSVTSIGKEGFSECSQMTNITLPTSLVEICKDSFSDCKGLTSVVIPEGVTRIGSGCFALCDFLQDVSFPNSLKAIKHDAFLMCALTTITLPEGLTELGENCFRDMTQDIESFNIPASLVNTGYHTFGHASIENLFISAAYEEIDFKFLDEIDATTVHIRQKKRVRIGNTIMDIPPTVIKTRRLFKTEVKNFNYDLKMIMPDNIIVEEIQEPADTNMKKDDNTVVKEIKDNSKKDDKGNKGNEK